MVGNLIFENDAWKTSDWFGTFTYYEGGWLYHAQFGWLIHQITIREVYGYMEGKPRMVVDEGRYMALPLQE